MEKIVLEITPFASPNIGGAETHLDKLRAYLVKRGWRVITSTYQPLTTPVKAPAIESGDGFATYRQSWFGRNWFTKLEAWPFPFVFCYLFPGLMWQSFWIALKGVDVIHAHGLVAATIGRILKVMFGYRLVVSTHASYDLEKRGALARILRWLFAGADFVLGVGQPSLDELIQFSGVDKAKTAVHRNWVDLDHFKPHLTKFFPFTVLFVGRLIAKKGILQLIEVAEQMPDVTFLFAGTGPEQSRVEDARDRLKNVQCFGSVSMDILPAIYNSASVTILPSQYKEGFSAVACESLACGTPVIASHGGVLPTILSCLVARFIEPTTQGIRAAIWAEMAHPKDREMCRVFAQIRFEERNAAVIEKALIR